MNFINNCIYNINMEKNVKVHNILLVFVKEWKEDKEEIEGDLCKNNTEMP